MRAYKEIFKEKGISPSYTRTRIYDYLETNRVHPTVDEIYQSLKEELPTLSKTTVYNVLKLFMDKEMVVLVNMNGNETRYELNDHAHSHFRCVKCGTIYDLPHIKPTYSTDNLKGFTVTSEEVNLEGICPNCTESLL
jgi:Fe2+ or Zn2+ uptake regulation protein